MGGSKKGYQKRLETMIDKAGGEKAYRQMLREWGSKGGKVSPGGFRGMSPERLKEVTSKGGKIGRRTPPLEDYKLKYEEIA